MYRVAPFPHEKNPLIGEQPKTRQTREAKQSQSEEKDACGCNINQRSPPKLRNFRTQSILETTDIIRHIVIE